MFLDSGYSVFDGASVRLANLHNSKYSYIKIYHSAFQIVAPFLAALTIKDSDEIGGTGLENAYQFTQKLPSAISFSDYSVLYYVMDGFLFLTILTVAFKVDFRVDRKEVKNDNLLVVLKNIWSIPMAIFLVGVIITGRKLRFTDTMSPQ